MHAVKQVLLGSDAIAPLTLPCVAEELARGTLVVTGALTPRPGYAAAVAAEGSGWTVRMRTFAFPARGRAR